MSDEHFMSQGQILLYQTEDGSQRIEVHLQDETVWLSQKLMAELFQTTPQNINMHLKNIFPEGEISQESVIKESLITASDGKQYRTQLYRLEVIIAIGYRVSSHRGAQFRQWATQRLKEYIVKGFTLDDERLSKPGGMDYFDELLDRIRAIRSSEKRFYQKIRDIYTLSADYDPQHSMTQEFFKTVQNKLLYAVTGFTAAEIIYKRTNASNPNMGLTTWDGAGRGKKLTKHDVDIAKNYLNHEEVKDLELLVSQYLDFAVQMSFIVAMNIRNAMEHFHSKHLSDEQMKELNPIIRQAIYDILNYLKLASTMKIAAKNRCTRRYQFSHPIDTGLLGTPPLGCVAKALFRFH